jgi:hypothetical protein
MLRGLRRLGQYVPVHSLPRVVVIASGYLALLD